MAEEPARAIRVIHDLERAIHHWELLRDSAQRVVNDTRASSEKERDSAESALRVARFQAYIAKYDTWILEAKARINELARGD